MEKCSAQTHLYGETKVEVISWLTSSRSATNRLALIGSLPIDMRSGQEVQINFISFGVNCGINFLEHVQINLHMDYTKRGNLQMFLISPAGDLLPPQCWPLHFNVVQCRPTLIYSLGTVSMLLTLRQKDVSGIGFKSWNLTSVHYWGENPRGQWRFFVRDPVSRVFTICLIY